MKALLIDINKTVADAGGRLPATDADQWRQRYRRLLEEADIECPPPDESQREEGKRGRLKRSKARKLLERLRNLEHDVLRFMDVEYVPFTNNQGGERPAHDESAAKDIRLFSIHGGGEDLLPGSQLPVDVS